MAKCLRCGAGNEWLEGDVRKAPRSKSSTRPKGCAPLLLKYTFTPDDIYSLSRGCRVVGDDGKLREPTRAEVALAQYVEAHNVLLCRAATEDSENGALSSASARTTC